MKHKFSMRVCAMLVLVTMLLCSLVSCIDLGNDDGNPSEEHVDYAAELKLDMTSETAKQEVSVHIYIDGDTTHFKVPTSVMDTGVLNARNTTKEEVGYLMTASEKGGEA